MQKNNQVFILYVLLLILSAAGSSFAQKKSPFEKELERINTLYGSGKYTETISEAEKLILTAGKKMGNYDRSLLHVNIGHSYSQLKRQKEAEQYLLLSVDDLKDSTEETKYQHALHKYYLASLYNTQGRYDEADKYYREAMGLLALAFGQSSKEYCSMFNEYAQMYVEMGRYEEAYPMINATVYFNRTLFGEASKEFLNSMNDMARIYQGMANYQYASLYFDTIISVSRRAGIPQGRANYAVIINNAGENYRLMADYELAEQYLLESLSLSDSFPDNKATVLNNLGLVYKSRGLYFDAERSFNLSINTYKSIGKENMLDVTHPYNNLGDLFRITGRYRQAINCFQKVVDVREAVGGTHHAHYANVLVNIALTYSDLGKDREAEMLLEKAYKIYKELLGDNHVYTANCLNNMGAMRLKANDLDNAERLKLQAIEIYKKLVGEKSDRYAAFLSGMISLSSKRGKNEKALEYCDQVEKILRENFGTEHYDYYNNQMNRAEVLYLLNKPSEAQEYWIKGIEGLKKLLREYYPYMTDEEKFSFNYSLSVRFESFALFVMNAKEKKLAVDMNKLNGALYNFQLANKASVLNESAEFQRRVYASGDSALVSSYEYMVEMRKFVANKFRLSESDLASAKGYIDSLETEAGKIERALVQKLNNGTVTAEVNWKVIADKLGTGSAAIELIRTENFISDTLTEIKYAALILKKGAKAPELVLLGDGNKLDKAWANEYRSNTMDRKEDRLSYDRYWKNIESALKDVKDIYFSGDGIYLQINPNTLLNTNSGKFLLEEKNIHFVTNTKDILNEAGKATATAKRVALFGNPDYEYNLITAKTQAVKIDEGALASRFGLYDLTPLPGTKKEVKEIEKVFSVLNYQVDSYLSAAASEKNVKSVKSPFVLHIATHGFFLPDVSSHSTDAEPEKLQPNPLLRSGLALAGASVMAQDTAVLYGREEDGILSAYEASNLNLQGTELVVLSACQTGLGETSNGQGVFGLQRSLLIAGARSLIMSMWSVDDYATQELMTEFYKEWLKNPISSNKLPSFRKAQQKVKEKYKDPFFWGAFVLLER